MFCSERCSGWVLLGLIGMLLNSAAFAAGIISPTEKYAWAENVGWLNFRATDGNVQVYADHLEGYVWAENIGWIHLRSTTAPTYYGVTVLTGGAVALASSLNPSTVGQGVTFTALNTVFNKPSL